MPRSPRFLLVFVLLTSFAFLAGPARAETPLEIVSKMDKSISGYSDQQMDVALIIRDTNGSSKTLEFTIFQKGFDKRFIEFTSGEMKGMRMLSLGRDNMFVYLPGMKRVRRVAAHGAAQSLAGSDFTSADMAGTTWAEAHDFTIVKDDTDTWTLHAVPKAGVSVYYGSADLKVQKGTFWLVSTTYNDPKGVPLKVMENTDATQFPGGAERFKHIIMRDARSGHATDMILKTFKVNQNLPDSMFTERELQWSK